MVRRALGSGPPGGDGRRRELIDIDARRRPTRVAPSVDALLAEAVERSPWKSTDSLSGSRFERVNIGGEPFVVKYVSVDDDWIMRATGDLNCRQLTLLESATLERLPATIDDVVVGCAPFAARSGHRGAALLMPDVSAFMVPAGGSALSLAQHRRFLEHMAELHATFWGFGDDLELFPLAHHYLFLTEEMSELESALGREDPVPPAVALGWSLLDDRYPDQARKLRALARDPSPLVASLRRGPQTLVHGDWKLGNLGTHADGRTILLDWDRCGEGPPLLDLAWYLAVNCDRLPESKDDAIAAYRSSLKAHGIATSAWWDGQLGAALVGAFVQLGWSKVDDSGEFGWWSDRLASWVG